MANAQPDGLVPFSMQPGRIDDFVKGMKESADANTRAALEGLGVYLAARSWPALKRYLAAH
jgi:hypothetical protein